VLFFTDGIIEEHSQGGGEEFGIERLVAELERAERQDDDVQVTVRRLSHALMRERGGATSDDATLFLLEWRDADADHLTKIDKPSTG
jgi:serine phosphatase RsbU (regulator of sigma subunit)